MMDICKRIADVIGSFMYYGLRIKTKRRHPDYSRDRVDLRLYEELKIFEAHNSKAVRVYGADAAIVLTQYDRKLCSGPRAWMILRIDRVLQAILEEYEGGYEMFYSKEYKDAERMAAYFGKHDTGILDIPYQMLARLHQLEDKYGL